MTEIPFAINNFIKVWNNYRKLRNLIIKDVTEIKPTHPSSIRRNDREIQSKSLCDEVWDLVLFLIWKIPNLHQDLRLLRDDNLLNF